MNKEKDFIPHNKPWINVDDISAVTKSLESSWLAPGPSVLKFEEKFCYYLEDGGELNKKYGVAVSSGTAALFLALYSLKVGPGDEVILPTYTCTALLNAINLLKAVPVLVDIDLDTWNLSYENTVSAITNRTKAIIITHTFGVPANIQLFSSLGIPIIEDCAQAVGASIASKKVGTFGDISIFSFYATKMITTGHGGMVISSNRKFIECIRDYINFDCRADYYPRFNFQMTDFQASLGLSQLEKLDSFISKRHLLASKYNDVLIGNNKILLQGQFAGSSRNFYRYVLRVKGEVRYWKELFARNSIKTITPIERWELLHRYLKIDENFFPNAETIAKSTISLPIFPSLSDEEVDKISQVLKEVIL
ncbi:DegT/DnrJ/EryC1/StrS family aminotransferase [Clostridium botulinum]|uniref:DegT/DnrJ/EryC1/StrS family aminotransferase n=1 Tax=Clostridium botulinum TaxID=1491 RepID=UPI001A922DB7|nr:DegT/DnrJ/EryC1/StrS family aminotransferase [Clostridium botulinum]MBO0523279.1 DegT/DnrJ/EryC1/StrS family aminotransferase [Clostridium botulinum]MBO0529856.1 DegT/DnrJ/EryC1/StrS family aminotransferase [Clostridium botulinum]MBO0531697.1 DegT/DnrJ/EryC1/StrS family aminotransferase [Clostridium botulinum]MBO0536999.1 DegT/DnrJ/EryC1/StrS family aminotransferase [Clostridium botulinum]MBO0538676.1 DegT/DnrJ/EryC1/StrS family aminotransferase [Clostridium botulinum]